MALNLVSLVQQFLTPQVVAGLARATGVNEAVAQRLVAAAIPVVLAAFATTTAAPGGAQRVADAVSNSDPDLLTKLTSAIGGNNVGTLNEGANMLGGLLGGSSLSSLVGALAQYAGVPQGAAQPVLGAVSQSVVGTIGQQDPSNWSDPSSIAALFASQKSLISAALPGELSRALGATGLLAGLGGVGAAAAQTASATATSAASTAAAASSAAANRVESAANRAAAAVPSTPSGGFPTWAIVLLVIIVLAAIWWFWSQSQKAPEPAKTGALVVPAELALKALPIPSA